MTAVLIAVLLAAAPDPVERGMKAYANNRFGVAITAFYQALSAPLGADKEQRARLHLAFSLWHVGRRGEADAELRVLLRKYPAHDIDPDYVHPDLAGFYRRVRNEVVPAAPAPEPKPPEPKPPESKPPEPRPPEPKQSEPKPPEAKPQPTSAPLVVAPASLPASAPTEPSVAEPRQIAKPSSVALFVRTLPLGIGQFSNQDFVGGALWLAAEVVLVVGNVLCAVLLANNGTPYGYTLDPRREIGLFAGQNVSAAALAVTAAFGVLDAHLWSPGRMTSPRR